MLLTGGYRHFFHTGKLFAKHLNIKAGDLGCVAVFKALVDIFITGYNGS